MNGVTVYGDVLFLINFSMDFLLLFSTAKIMRLRPVAVRLVISSVIGGAYGVAALFIENVFLTVVCNITASFVMCLIAYKKPKKLILIKCAALFYGLSLLLGGGITASYMLLSRIGRASAGSDIAPVLSDIPLGTFVLLGAVSMALSYLTGRIYGRQSEKKEAAVTVYGSRGSVCLHCLSDSGALLCEPLSGSAVVIVDLKRIRGCVDPGLYDALADKEMCSTAEGMRLIPCKGVNGGSVLPGFRPEKLTVNGTERTAVIAVTEGTDYGGFDGIVPASLC